MYSVQGNACCNKADNIQAHVTDWKRVSVCNRIQNLPPCEHSIMSGHLLRNENVQSRSLSAISCMTEQPTSFRQLVSGIQQRSMLLHVLHRSRQHCVSVSSQLILMIALHHFSLKTGFCYGLLRAFKLWQGSCAL